MSLSVSYAFSPTTTIESAQVNQNFTDIVNYMNNTASATGMVTMWAGAIGSLPTGWVLCNGSSGAPDLRDKFIVGAGNTYSIGNTGGANTHTLTSNEMPTHTHTQNPHSHTAPGKSSASTGVAFAAASAETGTIGPTKDQTATNQNTGGGAAHENRPPYYALALIYKS